MAEIQWIHDPDQGFEMAKSAGKMVLLDFSAAQDDLSALLGPVGFELVRQGGKWDKENRGSLGICPALSCQDLSRKRRPFLPKRKIPTGEE